MADFHDGDGETSALVVLAEAILTCRQQMTIFFPADLFADPMRDILLGLFITRAREQRATIQMCAEAANIPVTIALRWLSRMEDRGMVERRERSEGIEVDVSLSDDAFRRMWAYLSEASAVLPSRS